MIRFPSPQAKTGIFLPAVSVSFPNSASGFFSGGTGITGSTGDANGPYAVGTNTQYNFEYTQPFTVCAWVLPGQTHGMNYGGGANAAAFLGKFNISADTPHTTFRGWAFGSNGAGTDAFATNLYFELANSQNVRAAITSPTNSLHLGQYSFVCAVSDGSGTAAGLKIYINGVLQGAGEVTVDTLAGNTILNTVPFAIGGWTVNSGGPGIGEGYEKYSGAINQVTLWNVALTGTQINALYKNKKPNDPRISGPSANLIGYYPSVYKTDTSAVIHDIVGSNHLTNSGIALTGITLPAPAYRNVSGGVFDGSTSYVDCGNNFGTNVLTSAASYSFWATPTALPATSNFYFLFGKMDPVGGSGFFAYVNKTDGTDPTSINFGIASGSGNMLRIDGPTGIFSAGVKTHIVITYDGSENANSIKLYVNGSVVATSINSNTFSGSADVSNAFRIGARTNGSYFYNGQIDEFAIFSRALNAIEVSTAYGSGSAPDLTSLSPSSWYRFENGGQYTGYAPDTPLQVGDRAGFVTGTLHNVTYSNTASSSFVDTHSAAYNGTTSVSDFGGSFNQVDLHTHAHSWNVWFNQGTILNGNSQNGLFGTYSSANTTGYGVLLDTRILWYMAASVGHRVAISTGSVLTPGDNSWHMLTVTVDSTGTAGGCSIYLDGVRQGVTVNEDALNGTTLSASHFTLGNMGSAAPYFFHGNIDMFTNYPDYILTQYDINNLYSLTNPALNIPDPRILPAASNIDTFLPIGEGSDTTGTFNDVVGANNATNSNVTISTSVP